MVENIALTMIAKLSTKGTIHLLSVFWTAWKVFEALTDELAKQALFADEKLFYSYCE